MSSAGLLVVCVSAFIGVFVLLALLALLMRLIITVFPEARSTADAAMVAVVSTVVQQVYPGTKITKIQELK